ncbi:MAG TPA: alpha/beta hydrolase, partial [Methylomirabilota bacterium]|nr:alpha/beta hydrolase [Methylomirabilota bacterium]
MYVSRPGARIHYQVTGTGGGDLVLCPPCQPVFYSRMWKYQVPYLSRYFRVVTMDPRGNGRSDRARTGYDFETRYGDLLAVLEQAARPPFALVAFSCASMLAARYAVDHPGHLSRLVLVGAQYAQSLPRPFEEKVARIIRADFAGWRERLMRSSFREPHSLKGIEDAVAWAGESEPEVFVEALGQIEKDDVRDLLPRLGVPTLILHGSEDRIVPYSHGVKFAEAAGARLVTFADGGHALPAREPAQVNRLVRDFVLGRDVPSHTVPARPERKAPPRRPPRSARR